MAAEGSRTSVATSRQTADRRLSAVGFLWRVRLPDGIRPASRRVRSGTSCPRSRPGGLNGVHQLRSRSGWSTAGPRASHDPAHGFRRDAHGATDTIHVLVSGAGRGTEPRSPWCASSADGPRLLSIRMGRSAAAAFTTCGGARARHGESAIITPHNVVSRATERADLHDGPPTKNWHIALRSVRLDGSGGRELASAESDLVGFFPRPISRARHAAGITRLHHAAARAWGAPVHLSSSAEQDRTAADQRQRRSLSAMAERWDGALWVDNLLFRYRLGDPRGARLARSRLQRAASGGEGDGRSTMRD